MNVKIVNFAIKGLKDSQELRDIYYRNPYTFWVGTIAAYARETYGLPIEESLRIYKEKLNVK